MLTNATTVTREIAGRTISISTGTLARQANGAVLVQCGQTIFLATAVMAKEPKEDIDFFPLTVEYSEKMYASGKIPGGFFKREARPSVSATLTSRLIDRPIRPCFPDHLKNEVQVIVSVLSYDETVPPEFLAIISSSAALAVSDIPFNAIVGAVIVGDDNGQLVANPNNEVLEKSPLNIVVAGTKEAILMIEAGASEVSEARILEAIAFAHEQIKLTVALQEELVAKAGKTKTIVPKPEVDKDLAAKVAACLGDKIEKNMQLGNKSEIDAFLKQLEQETLAACVNEDKSNLKAVKSIYQKQKKANIRAAMILKKIRPDGRAFDEIRPIDIHVGILPTTHGSAVFTRGETQSLGVVTLGTADDEQIEDTLKGNYKKPYYFHYNFPPFSVGEVGRMGTGRRELGHGALAERALSTILPDTASFPYTIRIVSEILESNGSSSMASVCSGSLSLMDCGVPIKAPVSGIAMGLLIDGKNYVILTDIQGLEDHYGDMDFKVAGTEKGITALQLDIKVAGLSMEILNEALAQAKTGRMKILEKMTAVIKAPRETVSPNAPRIEYIQINPEKVGLLIGPGGKMIRSLEEATQASIIVTDGTAGQVCISARHSAELEDAKARILALTHDPEIGDEFDGKIVKIATFGLFIELTPGKEGLLHVSQIKKDRNERIEDLFQVGQPIHVKIREIDSMNRINLTQ